MSLRKSKPLQYDSLKTILLFMNANIRFEISLRSPSIRTAEKSVPLKIKKLALGEYKLKVGSHKYKIALKRVSPEFDFPDIKEDLDEYGFNVKSPSRKLTPGDILLSAEGLKEEFFKQMEENEKRRARKTEINKSLKYLRRNKSQMTPKNYDEQVKTCKLRQELGHCLKNNTAPNYSAYTQLTVSAKNGTKKFYRSKYRSPLFQGIKYLMTKFFENRCPIQIKFLSLEDEIVRLPVGIKFYVHRFEVNYKFNLSGSSLSSIFNEPIQKLTFRGFMARPDAFQCQLFQNVSCLTIAIKTLNRSMKSWSSELQQLRNRKIIFNLGRYNSFKTNDYLALIRDWRDNGREAGTQFEIRSKKLNLAGRMFNEIKEVYPGNLDDNRIVLPMVNRNSLVIQLGEIGLDEFGNSISVRMESVKDV